MFKDLAFYGSAAWVAIFLALIVVSAIEELWHPKHSVRYSVRGLFVAMTLAAAVLGIFSVVLRH